MRKFTLASLGLAAFLLGAMLSSAYLYVAPPAAPTLMAAGAGIGTPAVELATPGPEPTPPVVVDVAPTPAPVRPVHSALAPPSSPLAAVSSQVLPPCPVPSWTAREWVTTGPVAGHTAPDPASRTYGTIPVGSHIQGCVRPDGWAAVAMYGWVDTRSP